MLRGVAVISRQWHRSSLLTFFHISSVLLSVIVQGLALCNIYIYWCFLTFVWGVFVGLECGVLDEKSSENGFNTRPWENKKLVVIILRFKGPYLISLHLFWSS